MKRRTNDYVFLDRDLSKRQMYLLRTGRSKYVDWHELVTDIGKVRKIRPMGDGLRLRQFYHMLPWRSNQRSTSKVMPTIEPISKYSRTITVSALYEVVGQYLDVVGWLLAQGHQVEIFQGLGYWYMMRYQSGRKGLARILPPAVLKVYKGWQIALVHNRMSCTSWDLQQMARGDSIHMVKDRVRKYLEEDPEMIWRYPVMRGR
ncbi:MAG: hypothetical protein KatS3mg054_0068 [Chloroflexus sp.]|nr:MAG: hypothetical protein KatS3mg054_0068 [Chloroflexus sp.]